MKKKLAILLRGHTKRILLNTCNDGGSVDFDCSRGSLNSFIRNVLVPLKEEYEVHVYISASDSHNKDYILSKIKEQTDICYYSESIHHGMYAQKNNAYNGMLNIKNSLIFYDKIFITRFDLLYKAKIVKFLKNKTQDIIFPFWEVHANQDRVGDTFFWINNCKKIGNISVLDLFIDYWIIQTKDCCHFIKKYTDKNLSSSFIMSTP